MILARACARRRSRAHEARPCGGGGGRTQWRRQVGKRRERRRGRRHERRQRHPRGGHVRGARIERSVVVLLLLVLLQRRLSWEGELPLLQGERAPTHNYGSPAGGGDAAAADAAAPLVTEQEVVLHSLLVVDVLGACSIDRSIDRCEHRKNELGNRNDSYWCRARECRGLPACLSQLSLPALLAWVLRLRKDLGKG
jgi:hypothetical protein